MKYNGSTTLISGITQANNGTFPLVEGSAVQFKEEENLDGTYKSVDQKIEELIDMSDNVEYATNEDVNNIVDALFA